MTDNTQSIQKLKAALSQTSIQDKPIPQPAPPPPVNIWKVRMQSQQINKPTTAKRDTQPKKKRTTKTVVVEEEALVDEDGFVKVINQKSIKRQQQQQQHEHNTNSSSRKSLGKRASLVGLRHKDLPTKQQNISVEPTIPSSIPTTGIPEKSQVSPISEVPELPKKTPTQEPKEPALKEPTSTPQPPASAWAKIDKTIPTPVIEPPEPKKIINATPFIPTPKPQQTTHTRTRGTGRGRGRGGRNYMWRNNQNNQQQQVNNSQVVDQETVSLWVRSQIEYYFSLENLIHDLYFRSQMSAAGVVPFSILLNFNRVKSLTSLVPIQDVEKWVSGVMEGSEVVEVLGDGVRCRSGWEYWVLNDRI